MAAAHEFSLSFSIAFDGIATLQGWLPIASVVTTWTTTSLPTPATWTPNTPASAVWTKAA